MTFTHQGKPFTIPQAETVRLMERGSQRNNTQLEFFYEHPSVHAPGQWYVRETADASRDYEVTMWTMADDGTLSIL